jgi:hypothetical protein
MKPLFSNEQLNNMSKENLIGLMQAMHENQKNQEMKLKLLEEKMRELEFLHALISDKLTLA